MKSKDVLTMSQRERQLQGLRAIESLAREYQETSNRFLGYRYFRVTVEDVDGGEPQTFFTHCKPEDFPALLSRVHKAAKWPVELIRELPALPVEFDTGKEVLKRLTVMRDGKGGRPPGVPPRKLRGEYNRILNHRDSTRWRGRTNTEFFITFPEWRWKLRNAKKWDAAGRP